VCPPPSTRGQIHALEEELDAVNKQLLATNTKGDGEQVLKLKNEVAIVRAQSTEWQRQAELAKAELADAVKTAQAQITSAAAKVSLVMNSSDEQTKETLQQRMLQENRLAELSAMVGRCVCVCVCVCARARVCVCVCVAVSRLCRPQAVFCCFSLHSLRYEAARLEDSSRIADLQSECDELRSLLREAGASAHYTAVAGLA
jgi:hypothetical protein